MSEQLTNLLPELSDALAGRVAAAAALIAAVRIGDRGLSGIAWRGDLVVTSDQALPDADAFVVERGVGSGASATLVGRDPGTNVALLRVGEGGSGEPAARLLPVRPVSERWRWRSAPGAGRSRRCVSAWCGRSGRLGAAWQGAKSTS